MKLLSIILFKHTGEETSPVKLATALDLSSFNYFLRRTFSEHVKFATRTLIQRTPPGTRQTVEMQGDFPYLCHVYVRQDCLAGVVVADKEYPQRVAYSFMNKVMADFETASGGKWDRVDEDQAHEPEFMVKELANYQNPQEADKLTKIQTDLDQIKDVMHKNIDEVLKRGETLDSLMTKSEDLSMTSITFYDRAKKTNACCSYV